MSKVTYIQYDGVERVVDVPNGVSVMRGAVDNGVSGIDGDCGGECACATCHVYVDDAWLAKTGARTEMEQSMLEFADATKENSRLGCQIKMTEDLSGLVVRLPAGQH
ncbi:MAG: 2Fe-2S iron-sulfur cluster binding domain-containing protein [Hyphomicrobiales bacterium]|nr:2Fe-2S iron-sulfur cluster binding domain-containing protein [Hyphomicrobiales bacterium]